MERKIIIQKMGFIKIIINFLALEYTIFVLILRCTLQNTNDVMNINHMRVKAIQYIMETTFVALFNEKVNSLHKKFLANCIEIAKEIYC